MGASGGMKLFKNNSTSFIMVQQDKLQEYTAAGAAVNGNGRSMTLAGGGATWSALATRVDGGVTHYETTFTKTNNGVSFALTAHVSKGETTSTEVVPCSNCTFGTSGKCQLGGAPGNCSGASGSPAACAVAGAALCTKQVTLHKDELKFSIQVTGWSFAQNTNHLHYAIELKQKAGNAAPSEKAGASAGDKDYTLDDGGKLVVPTTATITGGPTEQDVAIGVTAGTQGSKFVIAFDFPNFASGTTLYYDPTMAVAADANPEGEPEPEAEPEPEGLPAGSIALIVVGVVALGAVVIYYITKGGSKSAARAHSAPAEHA